MALIFPRLAQNFIRNGYYPTDEATLAGILSALQCNAEHVRIHDPCCGEGTALAEVKHHLGEQGVRVEALGIELDGERAWHSKRLLDTAIHGDVQDVVLTAGSCGLLFLNPPYGEAIADKANTGERHAADRLEKIFFRRTVSTLQVGGVLVLIVPHYVLDEEFSVMVARAFTNVQVFMAPEARFKQALVFGVKRRSGHAAVATVEMLRAAGRGEISHKVLGPDWSGEQYEVPAAVTVKDFRFSAVRVDAPQLKAELDRLRASTLWPQFDSIFGHATRTHRRPLRDLSKWHLALALAAGQITGVVRSKSGRTLMIKGDTWKRKQRSHEFTEDTDGTVRETVTLTDQFVPVIRGIDMTLGPGLGQIVTIA
jgi:tRNA1(Val) A37 N6-methylase TrmN6